MDEGGGLENHCAATHRGFESLPLRGLIADEGDLHGMPDEVVLLARLLLQEARAAGAQTESTPAGHFLTAFSALPAGPP